MMNENVVKNIFLQNLIKKEETMIKFSKQIVKEIRQQRKVINVKDYVTGEPFEKWLRIKRKVMNVFGGKNK